MITSCFSHRHMEQKLIVMLSWIWVLIIYQTKGTFLWEPGVWDKGYSFRLMEWDVYWSRPKSQSSYTNCLTIFTLIWTSLEWARLTYNFVTWAGEKEIIWDFHPPLVEYQWKVINQYLHWRSQEIKW